MVLRIEVNSARLIERYVASGYGIGFAVRSQGFNSKRVRVLELPNFPRLSLARPWSGKLSNISKQLLAELETGEGRCPMKIGARH